MKNKELRNKYTENQNELKRKLGYISYLLILHEESAKENLNWAHLGDLNHVMLELNEIEQFLGGTKH